ncbi:MULTISPECIES: hypothetical protein [unclassified Saccharibacter]|uniref:hypothetical protein n=1 Tax=unclassified Saccharibacter TaxID=2648722 RepID=UPI0013218D9F|nr:MULTISPECIES: hypothetical protein [unclassified Saccharibacter]MXV36831.1 hypothetical protein [Saccharibacter sp. EH611]MXV58679.1 hypothetical protein [Saccharibacter sp. EH70]MXV66185.1 hypothetical protein [Saccharibacter sp. EH60]
MLSLLLALSSLAHGSDTPPTLCKPSEKVIISGETAQGYASLCAIGTAWHYRFGRPGHIAYVFPRNHGPAQTNFAWGTTAASTAYTPGADYSFTDNGTRTFIFYYGSPNVKNLQAGVIQIRDSAILSNLPFKTIRAESAQGLRYAIQAHVPLLMRSDPVHYPQGFRLPPPSKAATQTP